MSSKFSLQPRDPTAGRYLVMGGPSSYKGHVPCRTRMTRQIVFDILAQPVLRLKPTASLRVTVLIRHEPAATMLSIVQPSLSSLAVPSGAVQGVLSHSAGMSTVQPRRRAELRSNVQTNFVPRDVKSVRRYL